MAVYDTVALEYADVFNDIRLRYFEWPWLQKLITEFKPDSLLDLGCGNGYLVTALYSTVPNLFAVEPSAPMFRIAQKNLGKKAVLYEATAEKLPFNNDFFDMVISLLSFRYTNWKAALEEIHRVLKPGGILIIIDLFASSFNPLYLGKYLKTLVAVNLQYAGNREYRKKLKKLSQNPDWQEMVRKHPKRRLTEAKLLINEKFLIRTEENLSVGLRGKTAGLVCVKR